jgi:hypothetical protein
MGQSIFAWALEEMCPEYTLLASASSDFRACENISFWDTGANESYCLINKSLEISLPIIRRQPYRGACYAVLNCCFEDDSTRPLAVCLQSTSRRASRDNNRTTTTADFTVARDPGTGLRWTVISPSELE